MSRFIRPWTHNVSVTGKNLINYSPKRGNISTKPVAWHTEGVKLFERMKYRCDLKTWLRNVRLETT